MIVQKKYLLNLIAVFASAAMAAAVDITVISSNDVVDYEVLNSNYAALKQAGEDCQEATNEHQIAIVALNAATNAHQQAIDSLISASNAHQLAIASLNAATGSQQIAIVALNAATNTHQQAIDSLISASNAHQLAIASLNAATQAQGVAIGNLNAATNNQSSRLLEIESLPKISMAASGEQVFVINTDTIMTFNITNKITGGVWDGSGFWTPGIGWILMQGNTWFKFNTLPLNSAVTMSVGKNSATPYLKGQNVYVEANNNLHVNSSFVFYNDNPTNRFCVSIISNCSSTNRAGSNVNYLGAAVLQRN